MEQRDNLLEVIKTLFQYKKQIIGTVAAVGIGAVIIALTLPVYYQSILKMYPASQDLAAVENIFGRQSGRTYYYGTDEDVDRVMSIAQSGLLANFLIDSFDLYTVYDIDKTDSKASYYVLETFEDFFKVKQTKENGIELSLEDEDPQRAAAVVNTAFYKIDEIGQQLIKNSQVKLFSTVEKGVIGQQQNLNNNVEELRQLREKYGIYNVETQGEVIAGNLLKAQSQLSNDSVKLAYYKKIGKRDSVRIIEMRVNATRQQVISLNNTLQKFNTGLGQVAALQEQQEIIASSIARDQEQVQRLRSAYESTFPTVLLLERGQVPVIKSRPQRTLIVLVSMIVAFIFMAMGVLVYDHYKDVDWKNIINS